MHRLLGDLKSHASAWAFLHPVNGEEVVDYYDVIKRPMGWCNFIDNIRSSVLTSTRSQHD